jgi:hypothetical protein
MFLEINVTVNFFLLPGALEKNTEHEFTTGAF